jgi:hypothetical protein
MADVRAVELDGAAARAGGRGGRRLAPQRAVALGHVLRRDVGGELFADHARAHLLDLA